MSRPARAIALAVLALVMAACSGSAAGGDPTGGGSPASGGASGPPDAAGPNTPSVELTVFAAASLQTVFGRLAEAYSALHPGVHLRFDYDASSTLRVQIEQGASPDLFAAADTTNPARLAAEGLADGQPVAFAANRLVIAAPVGDTLVQAPVDLAATGVRLVVAETGVPLRTYEDQAVARLAALPGMPADFASAVAANVVSREPDARTVITRVALGEADAAIVYATDAASAAVRTIPLPAAAAVRTSYAAVVVRPSGDLSPGSSGATRLAAARAFLAWLTGPQAQSLLQGAGFLAP